MICKRIVTKSVAIIFAGTLLLAGIITARSTAPLPPSADASAPAAAGQPVPQPTPPSTLPRNLSQYALAGPFTIPDNMPAAKPSHRCARFYGSTGKGEPAPASPSSRPSGAA